MLLARSAGVVSEARIGFLSSPLTGGHTKLALFYWRRLGQFFEYGYVVISYFLISAVPFTPSRLFLSALLRLSGSSIQLLY